MPLLTEEQKKQIYAQHGVDESSYEISTEGDNYTLRPRFKPEAQPVDLSPNTSELASKNIPGGLESFGRAAATSVIPTAGGLAGAVAGAGAVSMMLPEPTMISKLVGAGLLGLAGSIGASKLQEAVVPESVQQSLFTRPEDVQEHPYLTAAGGFVPNALAFRPSFKDIGTLASGVKNLGNLARGAEGALSSAEQAAILNAGANIAPAAGMEAYDIASGNKPFDPLSSALNVLPGALFTRPTGLGSRLGFHDTVAPEPLADSQSVPPQNEVPAQAAPKPIVDYEGVQSGINGAGVVIRDGEAIPVGTPIRKTDLTGETRTTIVGEDSARPVKSAVASAEVIRNATEAAQKKVDYETSLREKAKQDAEEVYRKAYEEAAQGKLIGSEVTRPEQTVKPLATTELGKEIHPDYTGTQEADLTANAETPKSEAEWIQEQFDRRAKYQPAKELSPEEKLKLEDEWKADFEKEAARRGMTVKYAKELPQGNRGMYEPSKRQVTIATGAATKDTFSHEVGHGYVEDLLATGRKSDEQQVLRGLEFADKQGRKFKSKMEWDALSDADKKLLDESFVQLLGEKGAKLRETELYGSKKEKFKQWLGDVGSNLKYKLGMGGKEDVARKTAAGQRFDQPEYTQPSSIKELAATPKFQGSEDKEKNLPDWAKEEMFRRGLDPKRPLNDVDIQNQSVIDAVKSDPSLTQEQKDRILKTGSPKKSDYEQYQEVQAKLKEHFAKGDFESPEFQALWKENEVIKNRNAGHVPKPPTDIPEAKMQGPASEDPSAKPFFAPSRYDKVAKLGKTGEEISDNLKRFDSEASRLEGQIGNRLISTFKDYSDKEVARVAQYRHAMSNGLESNIKLTPNEETLKTQLDKTYREIGKTIQDSGLLVKSGEDYRKMILKEGGYQPNVISQKVIDAWQERTPDAAKYDKLYVDYMKKKGTPEEEAKSILQDYKQAVGNAGMTPDIKYNALRKAEGKGLPWELVEQNPAVAARRYGRRAANDLAFFKYIQDDPRMLKALGMKDQQGRSAEELAQEKGANLEDVDWIGGSKEVKAALRSVQGIDTMQNPVANALIRSIGNSVMETGTALRNIVSLPTTIAGYYGVGPKTVGEALVKMPQRAARAFENNAVRASFGDLEAGGIIEGNPNKFIALADKYSKFMRKYTGRDFSDKFEGEFTYSLGETLASQWFAQAKTGDIKARRMLNRFGTTIDDLKSKFLPKEAISQEDISKVAKNFVDATRGSYGPSGLPSFAIEGGAAPLVSLARWSIEKANVFQKDIIRPIIEHGDWAPLTKTAFAGLLTGAAIEELNKLLAGKKGADATIEETWAKPDIENVTAKVIGLLQLGSFGGMFSEAAKAGMATVQGKETKFNNPLSMPALTLGETVWQNTAYALEAAQQGEDKLEVLSTLMTDLLKTTFQNYRYADANFISPKETDRKEKFRDLRIYKDLNHEQPQAAGSGNPYTGLAARKFKRAEGMDETMAALPAALDAAINKSGGDFTKLKEEVEGLKRNSYQTFPKDPVQAFQYFQYLSETLGPEEAGNRYSDYLRQSAVNKAKNTMLPTL